jgi:hypothetical protein
MIIASTFSPSNKNKVQGNVKNPALSFFTDAKNMVL